MAAKQVIKNPAPIIHSTAPPGTESYPLVAHTVQASAFRTSIEAIKDILTEANLIFDASGMKIITMDESHTILVYLRLHASKFEHYHCNRTFILGVNMIYLFKLVKTMDNEDILTLYVDDANPHELHLKMQNAKKNQTTVQHLKLIETDKDEINIESPEALTIITMPSTEFQKLCRDMNALGRTVEIKSVGSQLTFTLEGDFAKRETIMHSNKNGMQVIEQPSSHDVVQGIYALRHLLLFTKCTNLCPSIKMYLCNDFPIIVEYQVANLGEIKLCLAQVTLPGSR
jgi:proliferating cell nuclear antigen